MRVSFTSSGHLLHPLGSPDSNYVVCAAKIQSSSLLLVSDANLKRLYLYDMRRPYANVADEVAGYMRDDLSISSLPFPDPGDGVDAVCGDICVDDSGTYIYALILRENSAHIKIYRHHNRKLYQTGRRYELEAHDWPMYVFRTNVKDLGKINLSPHIGVPTRASEFFYGAGIVCYRGRLYVLTRRKAQMNITTHIRWNLLYNPETIDLDEWDLDALTQKPDPDNPDNLLKPPLVISGSEHTGSTSGEVRRLRLLETRTADLQFSLLTVMEVDTGKVLQHYYLSDTSYDEVEKHTTISRIFHGLSVYDNQLFAGVREDKLNYPSQLELWHVQEAKVYGNPPEVDIQVHYEKDENTGARIAVSGVAVGQYLDLLNEQYSGFEDGAIVPTNSPGAKLVNRIDLTYEMERLIKRMRSLSNEVTRLQTPVTHLRGPTTLVACKVADLMAEQTTPVAPSPEWRTIYSEFPFGIAVPYSMTHDIAERKLYCVFGNQLWVLDLLDWTLIVNYPDFTALYEGDIIDMSDVTSGGREEIQCFIRNDAPWEMANVNMMLEAVENDPRWEDLFFHEPNEIVGHKSLALGNIGSGQSREFWLRIYSLDVKFWEAATTHTVPLRITYDRLDDNDDWL